MAISFGSIGTVCATFQGTTALTPGTICKMAVNGTVSACSAGDAFLGCVENSFLQHGKPHRPGERGGASRASWRWSIQQRQPSNSPMHC